MKKVFNNFNLLSPFQILILVENEADMESAFVGIDDHTLDGQKVHLEMLRSSKPDPSPSPLPEEKEKETASPKEKSKINGHSSIPKNYIPMQRLPKAAIGGDYFEVYIGDLMHPDHFYIQLKERAKDFNSEIIEEMQ